MEIKSKIEDEKLVLSHSWTDWLNPNTIMENKFSVPIDEVYEIISREGPKGGFKGMDILSKERNSYITHMNGAYETNHKILKSYSIYDRDARNLFKDLQGLLVNYKIRFNIILDK